MSNIIDFDFRPIPPMRPAFVELDGGVITKSIVNGIGGERLVPADHGKIRYFVTIVEDDGGRIGIWDGSDYDDAIREANAARVEWGIDAPVRDLLGGRE